MTDTPTFPDETFDLIYADPPWEYHRETEPNRTVENQYPTLSLDEIKALDPPVADDAVLYLWSTAPHLSEAVEVVDAWGFEYKTCAVWDKLKKGMGFWFRINHELLLVGQKGDYTAPEPKHRRDSIFKSPREGHSEKPAKVRAHIEQAHPDAKKLEMFSRDGRVGWTMWGNETPDSQQDLLEHYE
jgi:N6-adenosine-specific RNA methylase IME4